MSSPFVGEIRLFAGNFAPQGWAFCNGQLMSIADSEVLFNLIGTTYGGDGVETFALPNLASRIPFADGGLGVIGQLGGAESVTLLNSQLPAHTHAVQASNQPATSTTPAGNVWSTWGDQPFVQDAPNTTMDPAAVSVGGGGQPHENRPPFVALTFIISLFGIFPSQS
jgi:microcystin-dependent protein